MKGELVSILKIASLSEIEYTLPLIRSQNEWILPPDQRAFYWDPHSMKVKAIAGGFTVTPEFEFDFVNNRLLVKQEVDAVWLTARQVRTQPLGLGVDWSLELTVEDDSPLSTEWSRKRIAGFFAKVKAFQVTRDFFTDEERDVILEFHVSKSHPDYYVGVGKVFLPWGVEPDTLHLQEAEIIGSGHLGQREERGILDAYAGSQNR